MQRIKTARWPMRNPIGDRVKTKAFVVLGSADTIAVGNSYRSFDVRINNLSTWGTLFGGSTTTNLAGITFAQFRVRGVKLKQTVWPSPASTAPLCVFTDAAASITSLAPPDVATTTESRWGKYRVLSMPAQGAKPTSLSTYYSVNKVTGPDATVKNDMDYVGFTNGSGTMAAWTPPADGPWMRFGVFTMSGGNVTGVNQDYVVKFEATFYLEFFGKI